MIFTALLVGLILGYSLRGLAAVLHQRRVTARILKQGRGWDEWAHSTWGSGNRNYAAWWASMYGQMAEGSSEKQSYMIPTLNAWQAAEKIREKL